MRCLYCGKELPLLKRFGSSEFCSDAHRNQYQKEYTELALTRLMQAKPVQQQKPSQQKVVKSAPAIAAPPPPAPAAGIVSAAPVPVPEPAVDRAAGVVTRSVEKDPPMAGLFQDVKPTVATIASGLITSEFESMQIATPTPPIHQIQETPVGLPVPPSVRTILFAIAGQIHVVEGKVEAREFARAMPIVRWTARPEWGPERQVGRQPMDAYVEIRIPANSSGLWSAPPLSFSSLELELGEIEEEPEAKASSPLSPPVRKIRKSLSVIHSGIAPSKARPVQVFSSVLATKEQIEVPQTKAVPLRPVMLLQTSAATPEDTV